VKTDVKDVKTGGNVVGSVEVPVYENLAELTEKEDESRILSMFNKQNAVRIMENERAKHTLARVGKGKRFEIGFNLLPDVVEKEVIDAAIGNIDAMKELVNSQPVQDAIDAFIEEQKGTTSAEE